MLTRACTFRLRCFTDINNVHFKNLKFTLTCSSRVCYVFPWSLPCDSKHVSQRSLALALRGQTTASIRKTTTTQDTYPPGLLRRSIVSHSEIALLLSVWNGVERGTKRIRKNEGNVNWWLSRSETKFQNSWTPSHANWIFAHGYSVIPRAIAESSFDVPLVEEDSKNFAASSSVSRLITPGKKNRRFLADDLL